MQTMKSEGKTSLIIFSYSAMTHAFQNLLTLDNQYFATASNTTSESNYLTIKLADRYLYTSGYIIRSYPEENRCYLKSWKLYGSLNGKYFDIIHSIDDDNCLSGGKIGRYAINEKPFKYFKIVQTGPNSGNSDNDRYKMRISYLDFFGFMTNKMITEVTCIRKDRYTKTSTTAIIFFVLS